MGAQEPPVWTDFTLSFTDLEAKEMALFYREAIAITYGVSLQMLGIQTPGKLGQETESVEVSYASVDERQSQFNEFMDTKLIPRFYTEPLEGGAKMPIVTDWVFELPKAKRDDLLRKAQLVQANVGILQQLNSLGVKAKLNDDMTEVRADWSAYVQQPQVMPQVPPLQDEGREPQSNLTERLKNLKPGESIEIEPEDMETKYDSIPVSEVSGSVMASRRQIEGAPVVDSIPTSEQHEDKPQPKRVETGLEESLFKPATGDAKIAEVCLRCGKAIEYSTESRRWTHKEPDQDHIAIPEIPDAEGERAVDKGPPL